jgi:hypothetical protein
MTSAAAGAVAPVRLAQFTCEGHQMMHVRREPAVKTLDPSDPLKKKQIKASITDAIAKEVVGSNRDEIAQKVEDEYERLLIGAVIFTHIPSLTAGSVRREVMASKSATPNHK